MKVKGKNWTYDQVVRWCQKDVARREAKTKLKPGGAKAIAFIDKLIKKSDKAPLGWNEAYRKAKLEARGIKGAVKEKAKGGIFKAGGWFVVLVIVLPIVIIGLILWLWLGGDVDLPPEGGFTDEDFKP